MRQEGEAMSNARRALVRAGLVLGLVGAWGSVAQAQDPTPEAEKAEKVERPKERSGGPRVIELDDETIEGRIQKPEAFYILQHTSLNYERLDPKASFLPELLETVKRDPL